MKRRQPRTKRNFAGKLWSKRFSVINNGSVTRGVEIVTKLTAIVKADQTTPGIERRCTVSGRLSASALGADLQRAVMGTLDHVAVGQT